MMRRGPLGKLCCIYAGLNRDDMENQAGSYISLWDGGLRRALRDRDKALVVCVAW